MVNTRYNIDIILNQGGEKVIKVIAKMTIKEEMAEAFVSGASELVAETRREPGCISYQLFRDVNMKKEFTFIEEWATPESLQSHMKSKHFQEIMPRLGKFQEKDMELSVCTLVI